MGKKKSAKKSAKKKANEHIDAEVVATADLPQHFGAGVSTGTIEKLENGLRVKITNKNGSQTTFYAANQSEADRLILKYSKPE